MFSNEKDLVLKITNLLLSIWLIGSFVSLAISIINVAYPNADLTLEEYSSHYCGTYFKGPNGELRLDEGCDSRYKAYQKNENQRDSDAYKAIFLSAGSLAIVGLGIFIINKERK